MIQLKRHWSVGWGIIKYTPGKSLKEKLIIENVHNKITETENDRSKNLLKERMLRVGYFR